MARLVANLRKKDPVSDISEIEGRIGEIDDRLRLLRKGARNNEKQYKKTLKRQEKNRDTLQDMVAGGNTDLMAVQEQAFSEELARIDGFRNRKLHEISQLEYEHKDLKRTLKKARRAEARASKQAHRQAEKSTRTARQDAPTDTSAAVDSPSGAPPVSGGSVCVLCRRYLATRGGLCDACFAFTPEAFGAAYPPPPRIPEGIVQHAVAITSGTSDSASGGGGSSSAVTPSGNASAATSNMSSVSNLYGVLGEEVRKGLEGGVPNTRRVNNALGKNLNNALRRGGLPWLPRALVDSVWDSYHGDPPRGFWTKVAESLPDWLKELVYGTQNHEFLPPSHDLRGRPGYLGLFDCKYCGETAKSNVESVTLEREPCPGKEPICEICGVHQQFHFFTEDSAPVFE